MQRYRVVSDYEGQILHWFVSHRYSQADQEGTEFEDDIEATSRLPGDDQENAIMARQHLRALRDEQFTEDEAIEFQELLLVNGHKSNVEPVARPDITGMEQITFLLIKPELAISGHELCQGYNLPFDVNAWRPS